MITTLKSDNKGPVAVILANGHPPGKRLLRSHLRHADIFVCADGGANAAARLGVTPDLIIGDLDSMTVATAMKFSGVPTRRITNQNSTDLEKALARVVRKGCKEIRIFGGTGGRLDHTVGNLSALAKFSSRARLTMYDANGEIRCVGSGMSLEAPPGTTISLLPLTPCEGVTTRGLKWELRNESLAMGIREGTSNVTVATPVLISVGRGTLLLFRLTSSATKAGVR